MMEILDSSIENKEFKFVNNPMEKDVEEYRDAIKSFIDRVSEIDGILSVYKSGKEVSVPGISDVDLIVVLEDKVREPKVLRKMLDKAVEGYEYILEVDVMNEETFRKYYSIFPSHKELVRLYGKKIHVESKLDPNNVIAYLVDSLNKIYPHEFLDIFFFPKAYTNSRVLNILLNDLSLFIPEVITNRLSYVVDVRYSIHRMNSLRNDLTLFESISSRVGEWKYYKKSVENLRKNWFDLEDKHELVHLLKESILVCFDFMEEITAYLKDKELLVEGDEGILNPDVPGVHQKYPNFYKKEWCKEDALKESINYFKKLRMRICVLPTQLLINEYIRRGKANLEREYVNCLLERDRAIKNRTEYLSKYKFHKLRNPYLNVLKHLYNLKAKFVMIKGVGEYEKKQKK